MEGAEQPPHRVAVPLAAAAAAAVATAGGCMEGEAWAQVGLHAAQDVQRQCVRVQHSEVGGGQLEGHAVEQ
eukprot:scaffold11440_cov19-Tisochrysis_lutea.AAC.2